MPKRASLALALGGLLVAGAAIADFHGVKVSEVFLADRDAGTDVQYVELHDPLLSDTFGVAGAPYELAVYQDDGGVAGRVTLNRTTLAANKAAFLVSNAAADALFATVGHAELLVTLPMSGQVCFEHGDPAQVVHCLAWGMANPKFGSKGPTPGAGESLSLSWTTNSGYFLAAPTPGAANPSPPDAGPSPDAAPGAPDGSPGGMPDARMTAMAADDGGCGCRVAGTGTPSPPAIVLLGAALIVGARRRRR